MRAANLSDSGLLIELDVQELRILAAALTALCNNGHVLANLEDRLSGANDKAETLLVSLRSLNSIFDRLLEHAPPDPAQIDPTISPTNGDVPAPAPVDESVISDSEPSTQGAPVAKTAGFV
jgi:hypothetical protein